MNESVRKRKSLWDMKEEIKPLAEICENNAWHGKEHRASFHGGHDPKWSDLEGDNASKSKDCSGWPSWEPLQGNSGVQKDDCIDRDRHKIPETMRARGGDNSYHRSMSPAFDGWGRQTDSHSPDNGWSQSRRYKGRGRSRSRGTSRSRSRSRSGGGSRFRARRWSRSRSPLRDHRRESYGWGERRSGSGISSQTCRNFAAGKCRRGSQCRFLHQDNLNCRDGGHSENDQVESWRSRPERGGVLKYVNSRGPEDGPWEKVSDGYYGGDEPLRNRSKATIYCKDFLKGKCHRGVSCRYPHHDASGDNCDTGNRNAFFDHDRKLGPNKSGKSLCKFFAIGKCHRDDCRFSHDGPTSGNFEGRSRDDRWGHNLDKKNKSWNGPTWDDATGVSDIAKSTGWGDSFVGNVNFVDPVTAEKQTDDSSPTWKDKAAKRDEYLFHHPVSGINGADMGITEFMGMEKLIDREEPQLVQQGLQAQTLDGISTHVHEQNIMSEASGHHLATAVQPKVLKTSHIQLHHRHRGDNIAIRDGSSTALNEVKVSENSINLVLLPGQSFSQNGDGMGSEPPSSSSGSDQSRDMFSRHPSNGQNIDLNGPVQHILSPSNPQNQTQVHHEEAETPEMLEFKVPQVTSEVCQNVVISEQVAQISHLPALLTERLGNEQQLPQLYLKLNIPNSTGMLSSLVNPASLVPPIGTLDVQPNPATRSQEQYDPIGDGMEPSKSGNSNLPPGFPSYSIEHKNQLPSELLSPLSTVDPDSVKLRQSGILEEDYRKSPKLNLDPVANPEVNENNKIVAEKCKQEQENIHSENVDADGRVEEGSNSKDEKGLRLFKIALVEFVKEILKPTWKEGQMSREVHKTIVKKVVDKVTNTIEGIHVPKTQDKIDQYLSYSKPKITKLVQAYVERFLKSDS